jgi:hypothetical protein
MLKSTNSTDVGHANSKTSDESARVKCKTSDESARVKCKTSDESARAKHKTREQAIEMILDYVSGSYRTSGEIAKHIGMSHIYVLRNFITPMVKEGKLQKLYPQKANHPYQQYTSKKD